MVYYVHLLIGKTGPKNGQGIIPHRVCSTYVPNLEVRMLQEIRDLPDFLRCFISTDQSRTYLDAIWLKYVYR